MHVDARITVIVSAGAHKPAEIKRPVTHLGLLSLSTAWVQEGLSWEGLTLALSTAVPRKEKKKSDSVTHRQCKDETAQDVVSPRNQELVPALQAADACIKVVKLMESV